MSGGYENEAVEIDDDDERRQSARSALSEKNSIDSNMEKKFPVEIAMPELAKSHKTPESPSSGSQSRDPRPRRNSKGNKSPNFLAKPIVNGREAISKLFAKHAKIVSQVVLSICVILYWIYFGFAISYEWDRGCCNWCSGVRLLIIITGLAVFGLAYGYAFKPFLGDYVNNYCVKPLAKLWSSYVILRWITYFILLAAVIIFLVIDSADNRERLISASGILVFVLFGFVFSKHPGYVIWRQVVWGLALQFVFALLILRWSVGKGLFECLGDKVAEFLEFTNAGSTFVYGYLVTGQFKNSDPSVNRSLENATSWQNYSEPFYKIPLQDGIFAFKTLPVVCYFSFWISVLYYLGIMQLFVMKIGWLLEVTVGTTVAESINAAGNIFIGQTEAPLLVKPFIEDMTKSELHALMTGGFATVAGGTLAAYINFGIDPSHLLTASVMSAPAALGFAKLFYPETEESKTTTETIKLEKGPEKTALEAGANGASASIMLMLNIAANLIAFIAAINFLDALLMYFGGLVGWTDINFAWIMSKIFYPLAVVMGVPIDECGKVATLIGIKTIVNEFVAYAELAKLKKNHEISLRAEVIATYALCGFSNFSSIGIQLGGLGAMAPNRKPDLSAVVLRALISGSIACFLTACIAGALISDAV